MPRPSGDAPESPNPGEMTMAECNCLMCLAEGKNSPHHRRGADAASLTEKLIQAAVDYESGRCSRQDLSKARAEVEAAIAGAPSDWSDHIKSHQQQVANLLGEIERLRMTWRPIETAPTDGTWILIWEIAGINTKYSPADVAHYRLGEWYNADKQRLTGASHWMPLPQSPQVTTGERQDGV